jgi:membrane protein DedA with SNARE-associated domain
VTGILDSVIHLAPVWVYVVVGALVFAEDALFVGFVLPGETAAILGGVTASLGHTNLAGMIAIVVAAAVLGDTIGYEIGRLFGTRLLAARRLDRFRPRIERAREILARRGGPAVFLARFVAFLRATMPFLSGSAHMPYPTFLAYNAAGGVVWGTAVVLLGYLASTSYQKIESTFGTAAAVAAAVIAAITLVVWRIRRRRAERRP